MPWVLVTTTLVCPRNRSARAPGRNRTPPPDGGHAASRTKRPATINLLGVRIVPIVFQVIPS